MVFGTFDILHPGHLHFLRQARARGDFLIVSVARDANAKKFRGYPPVFNERERLFIIRGLKGVDRAVLGDMRGYLRHVRKEKPDIIALGYDQTAYTGELAADIASGKLKAKVVHVKPYRAKRHKSAAYKRVLKNRGDSIGRHRRVW